MGHALQMRTLGERGDKIRLLSLLLNTSYSSQLIVIDWCPASWIDGYSMAMYGNGYVIHKLTGSYPFISVIRKLSNAIFGI